MPSAVRHNARAPYTRQRMTHKKAPYLSTPMFRFQRGGRTAQPICKKISPGADLRKGPKEYGRVEEVGSLMDLWGILYSR